MRKSVTISHLARSSTPEGVTINDDDDDASPPPPTPGGTVSLHKISERKELTDILILSFMIEFFA